MITAKAGVFERNAEHYKANLSWLCERLKLRPKDFVRECGFGPSTASRSVRGEKCPQPAARKKISAYLRIPEADFHRAPSTFKKEHANARKPADKSLVEPLDLTLGCLKEEAIGLARKAHTFVTYIVLCEVPHRVNEEVPYELDDAEVVGRIKEGTLRYIRIEVFYSAARVRGAIETALELNVPFYSCLYFLRPPKSYPTINMRSYDDETFLIGGYDYKRSKDGHDRVLKFYDDSPLGQMFIDYAEKVRASAEDFRKNNSWNEVRRIIAHLKGVGKIEAEEAEELRKLIPTSKR